MTQIRIALRAISKTPGFAFIIVLILGLAIGLNTAIFSVVDAVFLRPFPLPDPDRLVMIKPGLLAATNVVFGSDFQMRSLQNVAGYQTGSARLVSGIRNRVRIAEVSGDFFGTLRAKPLLGRTLTREDELTNVRVAVICHELWRSSFGGDPHILGRDLVVNNVTVNVIGVMPAGFRFPDQSVIWIPFGIGAKDYTFGQYFFVTSFGRLAEGYSPRQAKTEADLVFRKLWPGEGSDSKVAFTPFPTYFEKAENQKLYLVWAAIGIVLLIGIANIAHLLLVKTLGRRGELAVRFTLGARPLVLVRQLLLETSLYVLFGGAVGLWIASLGTRLLLARFAQDIPPFVATGLDGRVLGFAIVTSVACALILTIVCALVVIPLTPAHLLRSQTPRTCKGRGGERWGGFVLVAGQVALAVLLLVCAGLTSHSLLRLHQVDLGFRVERVLCMEVWPPNAPGQLVPDKEMTRRYVWELQKRLNSLPGVLSSTVTEFVPLARKPRALFQIQAGGIASQLSREQLGVFRHSIGSDYFNIMGIPLLRGSCFVDHSSPTGSCPAVIDLSFADRFWPRQDAVGHRFTASGKDYFIVGVCAVTKRGPRLDAIAPVFYVPFDIHPTPFTSMVIRSESDVDTLKRGIRDAVLAVDASHPPSEVRTIAELFSDQISGENSATLLFNGLGGLGTLLACLGLYGTITHWVNGRRREIGIRVALGAPKNVIAWMVLWRSLVMGGAGLIVGLGMALGTTRYLISQLWGVQPVDLPTYAGVCILLVFIVVAGSYLPVRRALTVDPAVVLRDE